MNHARQLKYLITNPLTCLILGLLPVTGMAEATSEATYLANEGVMIRHQQLKVVFDPLYDDDYGRFENLPESIKQKLLNNEPPYDELHAAFVTHSHGDHFSANQMLLLMKKHENMLLFAPEQAMNSLLEAPGIDAALNSRLVSISPEPDFQSFDYDEMRVEIFNLPHSGWPDNMTDIHNVGYRVTLGETTVIHLGDADAREQHFDQERKRWSETTSQITLPPYWFVYSDDGNRILESLDPGQIVGIHVPAAFPDKPEDRPEEFKGPDLFTVPGETRVIVQ